MAPFGGAAAAVSATLSDERAGTRAEDEGASAAAGPSEGVGRAQDALGSEGEARDAGGVGRGGGRGDALLIPLSA